MVTEILTSPEGVTCHGTSRCPPVKCRDAVPLAGGSGRVFEVAKNGSWSARPGWYGPCNLRRIDAEHCGEPAVPEEEVLLVDYTGGLAGCLGGDNAHRQECAHGHLAVEAATATSSKKISVAPEDAMDDSWRKFEIQRFMERYIYDYFSCGGEFGVPGLRVFLCDCDCGGMTFYTIVEPDLAARRGRFNGRVLATCEECGDRSLFLSVLPQHPDTGGQVAEVLACECGNHTFHLGMGELFDDGFFDMGLVVGRCTNCLQPRVVVETD